MIKKILSLAFILNSLIAFAQTPCSGGFAGSYPCDGYDLQSFLPSSTFRKAGDSFIEGQDSWGWIDTANSREYAIVALDVGTVFVDITNPTSPVYVARLDSHTGSSLWRDVKVYQNHAYIVSDDNGNHGMQVYDLTQLEAIRAGSPPNNNVSETAWATWGTNASNRGIAHNIFINEDTGIAYIVGVSPYNSGGPVFFDLSTPASPSFIGRYSAGGYCHDAQVVTYNGPDTDHTGKEIMIGSFSSSDFVRVLDVTNKAAVTEISNIQYTNRHYTHQGWFTEDQRFFIVGDELDEQNSGLNTRTLVFDMQDLDNPILHYTFSNTFSAIDHNGYVRGNRYYLANYRAGMRVLKVDGLYDASPSMTEVGYFDTYPANNNTGFDGVWNVYPFMDSGNIIISGFGGAGTDNDGGLYIVRDPNFDSTDPVANCQNITATLDKVTGSVTVNAAQINNGSTDNIGIVSTSLTGQTTFTCDDIGDHNVTLTVVDDYGNSSSCIATITVEAETTEYQGGGTWTNGLPDVGSNAKISADYNTSAGVNASFSACTCEIDTNRTLTVAGGDFIQIEQDIDVNGTGSLIVEHEGIVVQTNSSATVNRNASATINVELTTPVLRNRDFMLLGSPMDDETRTDVFSSAFIVLQSTPANFMPHSGVPMGGTNFADDKFNNGKFWEFYAGDINVGEAFIVRPQTSYTDPAVTSYDMTYALGTLNNGDVTRPIVFNGLTDNPSGTPNMLANPYASPISASALINDNPLINEIYFWEHLTPPSASFPGSNGWNFSMDDISMFNNSMPLPAVNDMSPGGVDTTPNGVISTGQGFAIKSQGAGTMTFTNSMRLTSGNNTLRNPENEALIDKLMFQVRNADYGRGSYAGLAFNPTATLQLDPGYDSNRLATVVSLFSHLQDGSEQLAIQTMPQFDATMKIPFGFTTQIDDDLEYVISLVSAEGDQISNMTVYLVDNLLNTTTNINQGEYTFRSNKSTYLNRFTILFEDRILGPGDSILNTIAIFPNPTESIVNIESPNAVIKDVKVFDIRGRRIVQVLSAEDHSYKLDLSSLETTIYFVEIQTEAGSITKKIIKK